MDLRALSIGLGGAARASTETRGTESQPGEAPEELAGDTDNESRFGANFTQVLAGTEARKSFQKGADTSDVPPEEGGALLLESGGKARWAGGFLLHSEEELEDGLIEAARKILEKDKPLPEAEAPKPEAAPEHPGQEAGLLLALLKQDGQEAQALQRKPQGDDRADTAEGSFFVSSGLQNGTGRAGSAPPSPPSQGEETERMKQSAGQEEADPSGATIEVLGAEGSTGKDRHKTLQRMASSTAPVPLALGFSESQQDHPASESLKLEEDEPALGKPPQGLMQEAAQAQSLPGSGVAQNFSEPKASLIDAASSVSDRREHSRVSDNLLQKDSHKALGKKIKTDHLNRNPDSGPLLSKLGVGLERALREDLIREGAEEPGGLPEGRENADAEGPQMPPKPLKLGGKAPLPVPPVQGSKPVFELRAQAQSMDAPAGSAEPEGTESTTQAELPEGGRNAQKTPLRGRASVAAPGPEGQAIPLKPLLVSSLPQHAQGEGFSLAREEVLPEADSGKNLEADFEVQADTGLHRGSVTSPRFHALPEEPSISEAIGFQGAGTSPLDALDEMQKGVLLQERKGTLRPSDEKAVLRQLSHQLRSWRPEDGTPIRLQLEPERLGHLEIEMKIQEKGVSAHILTGDLSVKQLLEGNQALLREGFIAQGLRMTGFSVDLGASGGPFRERGGESFLRHNQTSFQSFRAEHVLDETRPEAHPASGRVNVYI